MLVSKETDIKLYYRFVEFTSRLVEIGLPHERFKRIILDDFKAESIEEKEVKAFANAYLYILNNINQSVTKEILQETYYLLTHKCLDEEMTRKILETYYMYYDENSHYVAMMIHFKILELVNARNIEFAFMISNLVMLKKGRYPFIPYEHIYEIYKKTIENQNKDKLMVLFSEMEVITKPYENHSNLSREEILFKIREKKTYLMKEYHIAKLYLYGSFAKERVTSQSDLDLLIIFNKEMLPLERGIVIKNLTEYLENKINIHFDIMDFSHALNHLDISEMENSITII